MLEKTLPYKRYRGRPPIDAAWSALVNQSLFLVENDDEKNHELLTDKPPLRGCFLTYRGDERSETDWRCQYYLGGKQRIIAKGSLYQCAKLYDCALLFFVKYRVKKEGTCFNFTQADTEADMAYEPAIGQYFESLENYLLGFGDLLSDAARAERLVGKAEKKKLNQQDAQRKWGHKQSASYQILSAIAVLRADVLELRELLETKNLTDS